MRNWRRVEEGSSGGGNGDSLVNFPLWYLIGDERASLTWPA
jgi:hypothetical protein